MSWRPNGVPVVTIKSSPEHPDHNRSKVEVWADGTCVGIGHYGGEPEDNTRGRDYDWVETVISNLARKLGADVECVELVDEED